MNNTLGGKVKVVSPTDVSADRYDFLSLSQAEPNLGVPPTNGYVLASNTDGTRSWVAGGGGGGTGATGVAGATGVTGATGISGYSGRTGATGANGQTGATGLSGRSGFSGNTGATGAAGAAGAAGLSGFSGAAGSAGNTGATGAAGAAGLSGFSGFSGAAGGVVQLVAGTNVTLSPTNGLGTVTINATGGGGGGATGATGVPGVTGATGAAGAQGATGATGAAGAQGATGAAGAQGATGVTGATGPQAAATARAIVDYYFTGTPATGAGGDEVLNFTFSSDYSATSGGFVATARTLPNARNWVDVAYGNGRWVAIATNSNIAAYSDDGISWTETTLPASSTWISIAYGNGKFIVTTSSTNETAISSDFGATWSSGGAGGWTDTADIEYGSGRWVVVTSGINYSSTDDGTSWVSYGSGYSNGKAIAYSSSLNTFVLVASATAAVSTNGGVSFTQILSGTVPIGTDVVWGNDRFLVVNAGTNIAYTSTTGQVGTWTSRTLPSTLTWSGVSYGNSVFAVLASGSSTILTSADGISYNANSMPSSTTWNAIAYGAADGYFTAVAGNAGGSSAAATITAGAGTSYNITLPAHGIYAQQILNWSPTVGNTPSQNATSLGNAIVALRATYSASYPSAGVVAIDTNSSGNITDTILVTVVNPTTGTLGLGITQGGGSSVQDTITVTDPGVSPETSQTYTFSPSLNSSLSAIVNQLAYDNTLTRYSMMATADVSSGTTGSKMTIHRLTSGAVGTLQTPTITVTTPGTGSSLAISRNIRSAGA